MSIVAQQLNYIYNKGTPFEKHALCDVNVEIGDGEFVAIVGHTGSGKTTFVQHLNALIRLQSGQLKVGDIDFTEKKTDLKKLHVYMVFQHQYS